MIGDVNLFFTGAIPSLEHGGMTDENDAEFTAELEIMIAGTRVERLAPFPNIPTPEKSYRKKGLALEALQLLLEYATGVPRHKFPYSKPMTQVLGTEPQAQVQCLPTPVPLPSLLTRISSSNIPSIRLFQKLGFVIVKTVEVFDEVEMRLNLTEASR